MKIDREECVGMWACPTALLLSFKFSSASNLLTRCLTRQCPSSGNLLLAIGQILLPVIWNMFIVKSLKDGGKEMAIRYSKFVIRIWIFSHLHLVIYGNRLSNIALVFLCFCFNTRYLSLISRRLAIINFQNCFCREKKSTSWTSSPLLNIRSRHSITFRLSLMCYILSDQRIPAINSAPLCRVIKYLPFKISAFLGWLARFFRGPWRHNFEKEISLIFMPTA